MNDYWQRYQSAMTTAMHGLNTTTAGGAAIDSESAFQTASTWAGEVRSADGTMFLVGNGASACMASHMAVDWTKNAGVRALAFNDVAFLTAIGNDYGYDRVFSDPVKWYARRGDLLVTISSSGNSPNVVRAIAAAREKGLRVVTFSGMKPDNASRAAGDLNFYVPAWTYGIAECTHQILLHTWIDRFMDIREWEKQPK